MKEANKENTLPMKGILKVLPDTWVKAYLKTQIFLDGSFLMGRRILGVMINASTSAVTITAFSGI